MIEGKVTTASRRMAAQLAAKARRMAEAHAANRLLGRQADARRWRSPALLWPLFTGEK